MDTFSRSDRMNFKDALQELNNLSSCHSKWFFYNVVMESYKHEDNIIEAMADAAGIDLRTLFLEKGSLADVVNIVKERKAKLEYFRRCISAYCDIELDLNLVKKEETLTRRKARSLERQAAVYDEKYDKSYDVKALKIYKDIINSYSTMIRRCNKVSRVNNKYIKSCESSIRGKRHILDALSRRLSNMRLSGVNSDSFIEYDNLLKEFSNSQTDFLNTFMNSVNNNIEFHRCRLAKSSDYTDQYQRGENPYLALLRIMALSNKKVNYEALPEESYFVRDCVKSTLHIKDEVSIKDYQMALEVLHTKPYESYEINLNSNRVKEKSIGQKERQ